MKFAKPIAILRECYEIVKAKLRKKRREREKSVELGGSRRL